MSVVAVSGRASSCEREAASMSNRDGEKWWLAVCVLRDECVEKLCRRKRARCATVYRQQHSVHVAASNTKINSMACGNSTDNYTWQM
jgi:hypothetical protein